MTPRITLTQAANEQTGGIESFFAIELTSVVIHALYNADVITINTVQDSTTIGVVPQEDES